MPLFDSEFLKKLEYLSLVSRRVFRGQILAQRRTMQLGGGIEFADHRDYTPGDDFRYLDWNVYARHDELLLKRFQEEEDLHVYILLDCSRSMALGSPAKFDLARQVAAALAYIALADLDRVAIVAFAGEIVADFPLTRGKARILSLLKFLDALPSQGSLTDLGRVVKGFVHRAQRRGLAIVISDLYDPDGYQRGLDLLRHHRHEPHVVQVFCKEAEPDLKGDLELYDVETETWQKVTVTERNLRQYRQIYSDFQESIRRYCNTYAIGCTRTPSDVPFDELILKMMRTAGAVALECRRIRDDDRGRPLPMHFANLSALALAGLAIPIVVFYILKVRLRRVPVATIMFWRQIFEEKKPRSLWQRLRHLLSLLLQLAFLALLVLALAEPFFGWESREARQLVLVVDNSASMNATDVVPTRLARAKEQGRKIIDGMRFRDEMAILSAGTQPQVHCGLTDHQRTLRAALEAIPATDGPTRVKEGVQLARRLLANRKNHKVLLLTDGGFADAAKLAQPADVGVVAVGGKAGNVGITRFQVRRSLLDPIGYEILAEVVNASEAPAECRLEIDLNGDPIDVVPLKLAAGAKWSQVFEKTSADGGRLVAKINRDDPLAADNEAWALLPEREPQHVTLVTKGNLFLEKVFESIPLVRLTVALEPPATTGASSITVFHRQVPARLPSGHVLVIEPDRATELWQLGALLQNPIVAKQDKDPLLMAHVRLDNVLMPEARQLTLLGKAQVLATSASNDPLYAVLDRPQGKVLVLTVNLDKSDLPLQTAFPILMTNALAWFAGEKGELRESVSAGATAEVALPAAPAGKAPARFVLRSPDGRDRAIRSGSDKVTVGPLDRRGIWSVVRQEGDEIPKADAKTVAEFACNLANREESDLRPRDQFHSKGEVVAAGFGGRPIWYYLLAVAWLTAGWEWFLYQRRWID